jgi:two-component system chemotaxis response regulator CheB
MSGSVLNTAGARAATSPVTGFDVVAIGASAGGIQVLLRLLESIPDDFPAAVLVVIHIGNRRSLLPQILDRASSLAVDFGKQGEPIRSGRVYIAPPDHHMLVSDGQIELSAGPRENHFRPAIDPLFRSVAAAYDDRAIGLVLSGALSDGTVGLAAIKARGGLTIVQDPAEALVTGMPSSALSHNTVDLVLTTQEIIEHLASGAGLQPVARSFQEHQMATPELSGDKVIQQDLREQEADLVEDALTLFTCPDCGGTLWQVSEEGILRFQCHVGHGWSWEALLTQKSDQLESALWATSRLFVERAILQRQIAERLLRSEAGSVDAFHLRALSRSDERKSQEIQTMLAELPLAASENQPAEAFLPSSPAGDERQAV